MKLAVTGSPGTGKTTFVVRLIDLLPLSAGGMVTEEIRVMGRRVGFAVRDLTTGRRGTLAHIHKIDGPRVGRYRVDVEGMETVGAAAIENAVHSAELVAIDEVGPMELASERFVAAVLGALESDRHLIVSVHRTSKHHLAYRIRQEVDAYVRITSANRDAQLEHAHALFLDALDRA